MIGTDKPVGVTKKIGSPWPEYIQYIVKILSYRDWFIITTLIVIALALNLYHLGTPGIWFDEAFSVELARQPFPLLWHIISGPEPNMELYYLLLHGWLKLTAWVGLPATEYLVRLPSALFATASTVLVFALGRRFLSRTLGALAAVLYALNYLQLVYAQETRSYALQIFFICLAWYALFAALTTKDQTRKWWGIYLLAWSLATYAHLFTLLVLVAQLIALLGLFFFFNAWRDRLRVCLRPLLISLTLFTILIIPMLLVSLHGPKTGWLEVPTLHEIIYLLQQLSGQNPAYLLVELVVVASLFFFLIRVYTRKDVQLAPLPVSQEYAGISQALEIGHVVPIIWTLLCWFTIPIIISYIISQGSIRLFSARYLVVIVPALCLLMASSLLLLRQRLIKIGFMLTLILLALPGVVHYYRDAQIEDWNTASHWLIQNYRPGDGLLCYDNTIIHSCQISMDYYLHTYSDQIRFSPDSPGAFSWEQFASGRPVTRSGVALDKDAIIKYASNYTRLFFIVGPVATKESAAHAQLIQTWLNQHYSLINYLKTPTVTVWVYHR